MTGLKEYLRKPFDLLDAYTSDRTDTHSVYGNTRSEESHFSIRSTQSGVSTYSAYEEHKDGTMPGTVQPQRIDEFDCEDPRTCPGCEPVVANN